MIHNYAQFGLFANGKLIQSGDFAELQKAALSLAEDKKNQYYFISTIVFDIFDEAAEGTQVISIYNNGKDIILLNELL